MSDYFPWKDEYSVGVANIDMQHKKLVAMVNELHQAMGQKQGKEAMGKILGGMLAYCDSHFKNEEQLMQKHGFPGLEEHRRKHNAMTIKVSAMARDYQHAVQPSVLELASFLKDWLGKHIMGTDQQYAAYFKSKGVS